MTWQNICIVLMNTFLLKVENLFSKAKLRNQTKTKKTNFHQKGEKNLGKNV